MASARAMNSGTFTWRCSVSITAISPQRQTDIARRESVHQLERVIHVGPIRVDCGRRRDEKVMISGALTLLANAVIAYKTWKLRQVLERSREAGRPVPSDAILRSRAHPALEQKHRANAAWDLSEDHALAVT